MVTFSAGGQRDGFAGSKRQVTEAVKRLLDEHMAGIRPHHDRIWALLMLELWFAMWIDGDGLPVRP